MLRRLQSFEIEIAIAVMFAKIATGAVTYCGARLLLWKVGGRPEILEEKFSSLVGSLLSRRVP